MGNVTEEIYPNYAVDILKENAPIVEIDIHLNRAYLYFDFPGINSNQASIYLVSIVLYEYGSSDLIEDNIIGTERIEFNPMYTAYVNADPELPLYHAYKNLRNSWYKFEISYVYQSASLDGGMLFYSNSAVITLDNSIPVLYKKFLSDSIRGKFRNRLFKNKSISIWYYADDIIPVIGDMVFEGAGVSALSIKDVSPTGDYYMEPTSEEFKDIYLKITTNELFSSIIETYFKGEVPIQGSIPFRFEYNQETYIIFIHGSIKMLQEDYRIYWEGEPNGN